MRRARAFTVLAATAALALVGCGGDDTPSSASKQPASKDPATLLASIRPQSQVTGPQKIGLNVTFTPKGTPTNPSIAALLSKPVTASLSGVGSNELTKADLSFAVSAGPIDLKGALRVLDKRGYLQLSDVWYEIPLDGSGGSATAPDPTETLEAFGDPGDFVKDVTYVGAEDVEGIATDHIRGTVDVDAFLNATAKAAAGAGGTAEQATAALDQVKELITSSTADIWIGEDKMVHKLSLTLAGTLTPELKAGIGLDGFDAVLTTSSVPAEEPNVEAPDNPRPASELQNSLGGLLGGLGSLAGSAAP